MNLYIILFMCTLYSVSTYQKKLSILNEHKFEQLNLEE
jgi:hypothetical protein